MLNVAKAELPATVVAGHRQATVGRDGQAGASAAATGRDRRTRTLRLAVRTESDCDSGRGFPALHDREAAQGVTATLKS